jgi:hypothetical protein
MCVVARVLFIDFRRLKKKKKKRHQELDKLAQLTALVLFSLLWMARFDQRGCFSINTSET